MPRMYDLNGELTVVSVQAPATIASTTDTAAVDLTAYDGKVMMTLNYTASGSAGISTTVTVIDCDTSGGTYAAVSPAIAFTAFANAAGIQQVGIDTRAVRQFIKLRQTVAGGSSASVISAVMVGEKKYK